MKKVSFVLLIIVLVLAVKPALAQNVVDPHLEDENGLIPNPSDSQVIDYRQWYPFYRSQSRGQRSLHWWHNQGLDEGAVIRGQSTYRYATQPPNSTLPTSIDGQNIEYYLQWYCTQFHDEGGGNSFYDPDPECKKFEGRWLEVQSEHRRSNKTVALLSWGYGWDHAWSVFFDPATFSSCTTSAVQSAFAANPGLKTNPALRSPVQWYAPQEVSSMTSYMEAYGPPVCAVVFDDFEMTHVLSARLFFVVATREDYQAAGERPDGRPVQLVINRYFEACTTGSCSDADCMTASDVIASLPPLEGEGTVRPHLLDTTRSYAGQPFCAKSYEPFWTRQTQVINGVRHHGMGYWQYFSSNADVTALDRNYTIASGQVWCEGSFHLPWENFTGWGNHVACAHDPTQGDDGP